MVAVELICPADAPGRSADTFTRVSYTRDTLVISLSEDAAARVVLMTDVRAEEGEHTWKSFGRPLRRRGCSAVAAF